MQRHETDQEAYGWAGRADVPRAYLNPDSYCEFCDLKWLTLSPLPCDTRALAQVGRRLFLSSPGLRKQIRIAQAGQNNMKGCDCKIFEMAVVRGKDNTLSETNHYYHQV